MWNDYAVCFSLILSLTFSRSYSIQWCDRSNKEIFKRLKTKHWDGVRKMYNWISVAKKKIPISLHSYISAQCIRWLNDVSRCSISKCRWCRHRCHCRCRCGVTLRRIFAIEIPHRNNHISLHFVCDSPFWYSCEISTINVCQVIYIYFASFVWNIHIAINAWIYFAFFVFVLLYFMRSNNISFP